MVIDFNKIDEVANPNFKGGEGDTMFRTFNDGTNKIMRGRLEVGCSIGYHSHDTDSEIMYFLEGEATVLTDAGEEKLLPGQAHYCPMGHSHSLVNRGDRDLKFLAVVPTHSK